MKRTALTRKTPLARTSRMPARRSTPRRSSRVSDPAYLAWVRTLVCCARDLSPCSGGIEADHAAKKVGGGRKSDDRGAIALCRSHHQARHDYAGPFRSWTAPQLRAWLDEHIVATQDHYQRRLAMAESLRVHADATTPGAVGTSSAESSAGHRSSALEQLLPEPGAIAVGAPVTLGTRDGTVSAVLPGGRVAVHWLDGEITDEALPSARHHRRA